MRFLSLLIALAATTPLLSQGFSPEDAIKRMQLPPGFTAKVVACEPMIRQPLSISFDEKGRMWVLQYLQYPNPVGLKAVKQDQYLRTVWDRVPEPPPKGPKGLDRITICSDPDENGRFTKSKDFITGLNLATGFCIGGGGVYVVQPPYLLFYPDKDHDDVPDGDPEVCVTGFGMEDTHSYANSLQWGPDGWLYGAHGSTVTAKIANPANPKEVLEFQQGIWRYHPKTKRFELFSEGGGNTYGLDFDKHGQAIAGTNWGGFAMLHQMQGAYYVKGFAKHGPLHNPYTYGYLDHVPYKNFKGGHVTCGGIIYQGDAYPKEYQDQYIAGNLLSNAVYWHKMTPKGSSFTAEHGGDLLVANDTWFRPVDCFQGPDGSVYVADWYDKRAAHLDPIDNWDKTNGRVYKIEYQGTKRPEPFDLRKKTSAELVELLKHPNKWWRNEARRLLAERQDKSVVPQLKKQALEEKGLLALESLWALYSLGGFDEKLAVGLLRHPNEHVRTWTIRLTGDDPLQGERWADALVTMGMLSEYETSPTVVAQLACTAKRIPGQEGNDLTLNVLCFGKFLRSDPALPLLAWWAVEAKGERLFDQWSWSSVYTADDPSFYFILERIARKAAATNGKYVLSWLTDKPNPQELNEIHRTILKGLDLGLNPNATAEFTAALIARLLVFQKCYPQEPLVTRLLARLGDETSYRGVVAKAEDATIPEPDRLKLIDMLGELHKPDALPLFVRIFQTAKSDSLRSAAINALAAYSDKSATEAIQQQFPMLSGKLRQQALGFLLAKPATALAVLLDADAKKLDPKSIPVEQLRPVLDFKDAKIDALVIKHFGKIGAATPGEKMARIAWLNAELGKGAGDAASGKTLFTKNCAACHTLFGEGAKIGPDLTTADRKNRQYMLTHIVDPSLYVRPEFMTYNVLTQGGRRLSGLVMDPSEASVTLANVIENKPVKTVVAKKDIEEMLPSAVSLMPEKMLDTLSYQEIRDLFAYLQSETPVANAPGSPKTPGSPQDKKDPASRERKRPESKLKVLLISGSVEYKSDDSLAAFQKHLEATYPVEVARAFRKTDEDLPGLEGLETCDVAVFFTRRLKIDGKQLDMVKKYATSGKPIVAIRTASHGFQNWLAMDKEVLGGDYGNHYGHDLKTEVKLTDAGSKHAVLNGVKAFPATGGLYKNANLAKDVTILMTGTIPEHTEPITWVRDYKGGRVFYTSLGHPDDFKNENFVRMLTNAVFWTAKREVPK